MKVLMISAGNKGLTFAEGLASYPNIKQKELLVYHKNDSILEKLSTDNRFSISNSLEEAVKRAHILFIAVKPYHYEDLFKEIKPYLNNQQILFSLMAGVTLDAMINASGI